MFDISFVGTEPELQDDGWYSLAGEVILGDYRESFLASLTIWSRSDYERQWIEAASRLVNGEERSAFFTSAFQFWWAMWRDGDEIRVHEELLTPERIGSLRSPFDTTRAPYHLIRSYERTNFEGEAISEWRLTAADIETFLARQAD